MTNEFEDKYRLVRETVFDEKYKVLNIHHDCQKIHETVKNSAVLKRVESAKKCLVDIIQSPSFQNVQRKEEYLGMPS